MLTETLIENLHDYEFLTDQQFLSLKMAQDNIVKEIIHVLFHEMVQPMTSTNIAIGSIIHQLENNTFQPEKTLTTMKKLIHNIEVKNDYLRHIRNLIGQRKFSFMLMDLNKLIKSTTRFFLDTLNCSQTKIDFCQGDHLPKLSLDKSQIEQMILNLLKNCVEAFQPDGKMERLKISISTQMLDDHTVKICISDNGPGFAPEIQPRVFEPFTTTKKNHLGLGLTISRSILEAHHGKLLLAHPETMGAHLEAYLPVPC